MKDINLLVELTKVFNKLKIIPDHDEKKKRIKEMCEGCEKYLYKYTENNAISGTIVTLMHYIYMFAGLYFIWFVPLNKKIIIFMMLVIIIHLSVHLYFGGYGCIVTRIERYLFNSEIWYGPLTVLKYLVDFDVNRNNIDNMLLSILVPSFAFFFYKLYKWLKLRQEE